MESQEETIKLVRSVSPAKQQERYFIMLGEMTDDVASALVMTFLRPSKDFQDDYAGAREMAQKKLERVEGDTIAFRLDKKTTQKLATNILSSLRRLYRNQFDQIMTMAINEEFPEDFWPDDQMSTQLGSWIVQNHMKPLEYSDEEVLFLAHLIQRNPEPITVLSFLHLIREDDMPIYTTFRPVAETLFVKLREALA